LSVEDVDTAAKICLFPYEVCWKALVSQHQDKLCRTFFIHISQFSIVLDFYKVK
jgi:hypothetical protein